MAHGAATGVAVAALLLVGCGNPDEGGGVGEQRVQDDHAEPVSDREQRTQRDDGMVDCGGSTYDPASLSDAPEVSSLPAGPAGAIDDGGSPALDPSQDWRVVQQSKVRVDLVRELGTPMDLGGGDVRTHESRVLERITGAPNVPDGTWLQTSFGPCAQRLIDDGGLGVADLMLAREPSPESTIVDLLVHERACASGGSAEGRIELLELEETDDQIRLRIGVRPIELDMAELPEGTVAAVTCQGHPPTPYSVDLDEPLGDREVIDASVVPAQPLTADGHPDS